MSADPYPNAGRASGYTTEEGHAIGEDLVNKVTEIVSASQTRATQQMAALTANIQALSKAIDGIVDADGRQFDYVLGQVQFLLDTHKARFDGYGDAIERVEVLAMQARDTLSEVATRQGKSEDAIKELNERHGAQWSQATDRIGQIETILRERPAQRAAEQQVYNDRMSQLEAELAHLRERVARLDRGAHDGAGE